MTALQPYLELLSCRGAITKPDTKTYTVALPWYEREDFAQLRELASDRDETPGDYEAWHRQATSVISEWLSRGKALQVVTVRPAEFLAWLEHKGLPNIASTRKQYVEEIARSGHVRGPAQH